MAEEIDCENRHLWNFKSHVTLTLTSDDLEIHIVVNVSSTLTNSTIWFVPALCLIVDVRTDVRMYGHTYGRTDGRTFLPGLLGHLKRWPKMHIAKYTNTSILRPSGLSGITQVSWYQNESGFYWSKRQWVQWYYILQLESSQNNYTFEKPSTNDWRLQLF